MTAKNRTSRKNSKPTAKSSSGDLAYVNTATRKVLKEIVGDEPLNTFGKRMSFSYENLRRVVNNPDKSCNPTVLFLTDFAGATGRSVEEVFQRIGKEIDEEKERQRKEKEETEKNT